MTKDIIITNEKNEYLKNKDTMEFTNYKEEATRLNYPTAMKIKHSNEHLKLHLEEA